MPQLRALFCFIFFLTMTGLSAQSAITANLNVTGGSATLEGYTDPGKTFITLLSTDAVPIFEARLEIRLSVGQRTYVLNRNGEAGTISLVSNVPTLLQGLDLAEYFTPNALDPFQRQQLLDDGGLLPGGQVSVCVALYDIRFPGAPPVSNNACALAYFEYAQPPLLIGQPDPVAYSIPQAINFQWIPQQFFPASYTIEIWDAQSDLGFGQLFIVNNTPPLVQETVVSSQFLLTDFYPLLPPQTDYIWRVRAEDLVQNRPFINDGFSELGFFRIASDMVANGCYSIEDLTIEEGLENPLVISYSAATEAFNNAHSIEIRDPVTGLLLIELDVDSGTLLPSNHRGVQAWTSGPITEIEPTTLPLRIEICVSCDYGVDEICEVVVYEGPPSNINILNDGNPCPPPVDNLSWVLASENSVSLSWTPEPTATGYTIDVRNLSTPPTTASDAPPEIFYETEQPLENLTAGDQYRVVVCYQCSDTGEDRCATIYFVLPDLADCNPVLSPVDIAVTPTTAGFAWDVDSEWVDGYSLRVGADSVTIPVGQNSYLWEGLNEGTAYAAELCVYCPGGDNTFRNCVNVGFTTTQFICADEPMLDQRVSISSQASGGILVDWSGLPAEVAVQGGIVTLTNTATLLAINSYTIPSNASFHVFEAPENEPPYLVRFCLECEGEETCYEQTISPPSCEDLTINGLNAAETGSDFAQLYWAGPNGFAVDEYRLKKRLTEGDNTEFESIGTTTQTGFRVEDLLPMRTYELEICFDCDAENQRCDTLEITTEAINCSQAAEEPAEYSCGSEADIPEFGQVPLVSHLSPGDSVVAGDFIVLITNVESAGSPWRGSGRIMVPYLNEVELSVDFEAIEVNENCRMTSGEMIVKPPFANLLEDLSDMIDDVTDVLGSVDDILGDILDILGAGGAAADYLGPILEILEVLEEQLDNNPFISPEAESLLEDAILCLQSSIATGNPAACTEILEDLQEALAETYAADYQVPFHRAEGQVYGYDTLSYPEMDILNWYPSIPPIGGRPYTGAWVSMPEGTGDITRAVRVPSGSLDSIRFFGTDSTEIAATITNNGFDLDTDHGVSPVIYAVHPKADSTGEMSAKIAGQLSLVAYQQKYLNVVLVPVNGANAGINAAEVEMELQRIFGPAVVQVSVTADDNLPVSGVGIIPDIASGVRQYPAALRQIINTYEDERPVVDETYYIFLVEEGENERTGFMPRKKQFGFLFLNRINDAPDPPGESLSASQKVARLAGHELGHGAYHLRHTFEEVGALDAGDTDNLMDYALGGRLHKWQWDFVEDPVGVVGVFEGDGDGSGGSVFGELINSDGLSQCYRTPFINVNASNQFYYTPSGIPIYIPVDAKVQFYGRNTFIRNVNVQGTLRSFTLWNGEGWQHYSALYWVENLTHEYAGYFAGYGFRIDDEANYNLPNISWYQNSIENDPGYPDVPSYQQEPTFTVPLGVAGVACNYDSENSGNYNWILGGTVNSSIIRIDESLLNSFDESTYGPKNRGVGIVISSNEPDILENYESVYSNILNSPSEDLINADRWLCDIEYTHITSNQEDAIVPVEIENTLEFSIQMDDEDQFLSPPVSGVASKFRISYIDGNPIIYGFIEYPAGNQNVSRYVAYFEELPNLWGLYVYSENCGWEPAEISDSPEFATLASLRDIFTDPAVVIPAVTMAAGIVVSVYIAPGVLVLAGLEAGSLSAVMLTILIESLYIATEASAIYLYTGDDEEAMNAVLWGAIGLGAGEAFSLVLNKLKLGKYTDGYNQTGYSEESNDRAVNLLEESSFIFKLADGSDKVVNTKEFTDELAELLQSNDKVVGFIDDFSAADEEFREFFVKAFGEGDFRNKVRAWDAVSTGSDAASVAARSNPANLDVVDEYLFEYPNRVDAVRSDFVIAVNKQQYIDGLLGPGSIGDIVKHKVEGLYQQINPSDDLNGILIDLPAGNNVRITEVNVDQGVNGYFNRYYEPTQNRFVFNEGFIGDAPSFLDNGQTPLIMGRGIPTQMLVTLRQMKSLGIPSGTLQSAKMSTIQNKVTILWLAKTLKENSFSHYSEVGDLILSAPPKSIYPIDVVKQAGYRVNSGSLTNSADPALPTTETTMGELLNYGYFGLEPGDLAAYGLLPSDKTFYNFNIIFTLETF